MIIYFMRPLHAAGAITEDEITKFETLLVREKFGLKGDIKSEEINKVTTFYIETTASVMIRLGSKLRNLNESTKRAKAKKRYQI